MVTSRYALLNRTGCLERPVLALEQSVGYTTMMTRITASITKYSAIILATLVAPQSGNDHDCHLFNQAAADITQRDDNQMVNW